MRLLFIVIVSLIAAVHAQTFCEKYAVLFGPDLNVTQIMLMNATVEYAFGRLYTDPRTANWFNGVNNAVDYGAPANAGPAQVLKDHLIGFFGAALGCESPGFVAAYGSGFSTDMTAVHSSFTTPINKAAYETFNSIIIDFLYLAGVTTDDQIAVATALDGFRARATTGPNNNQVCQATDCEMSPYSINVGNNYFSPPYISVPNGFQVTFIRTTVPNSHTVTSASNTSICAYDSLNPVFDAILAPGSIGTNYTTPPLTTPGMQQFLSIYDCNQTSPQSMYGVLNIGQAPATFCQKYAAAVFGADNLENEIQLMNFTVLSVFAALYTDPITRPWFNGSNNPGSTDFGTDTAAAAFLVDHLIAFFGAALGCVATNFSDRYPVSESNMTTVHSGFPVPITKASYERFNQIVIDVLAAANVEPMDLITVASVLDGFRTRPASGPNSNQVCQSADCTTSPYQVLVRNNYFNPPYITVPTGGAIEFVKATQTIRSHTVTHGVSPVGTCTANSDSLFNFVTEFGSGQPNGTATNVTFNNPGLLDYYCSLHCASGMYAQINAVGAPINQQTFCQKYAAAVFGADNLENEIQLMNFTVLSVFAALYTDPITRPWFNGSNNPGSTDFGTDTAAAAFLVDHLIAFFGAALGCVATNFSDRYPVSESNMTTVHSGFPVPITKASYERFNQIVIEVLISANVEPADVYTVASVLDGFRTRPASGPNSNQVCQSADCTTSPYQVLVRNNYFNPPYITVPTGGAIEFVKATQTIRSHTVTHGVSPVGTCDANADSLFDLRANFSSAQPNGTSASVTFLLPGEVDYYCDFHCSSSNMWGTVNVVGAPIAPPTFCEKYATALFGNANATNEANLINATVLYAFGQLYADPDTKGWFNGTLNGGPDFGTDTAAAATLVDHLIAFFGAALGCRDPDFVAAYPVIVTDMTGVHAGFAAPVNKAAYERFNQIIIDFLFIAGVEPADVYAVASVLDGFRMRAATGPNTNQVCQAADCTTSPFNVRVTDTYFNPPYITVPSGVQIAFDKRAGNTHTIASLAGDINNCTLGSPSVFSITIPGAGANGTIQLSPAFVGAAAVNYAETSACGAGFTGTVNIIPQLSSSVTFCQKYATALFGVDTAATEIALINATVLYAFGQLYADPVTQGWFNGTLNGGPDFGTNPTAATTLVNALIGFFGAALGCTQPGFAAAFPLGATNMTAIHSTFAVPINKAAYERFNQIIIDFLAINGVSSADRVTVASVLDGFRARAESGPNNNQICQASDCTTSPYQVIVKENYFNPPYLSLSTGQTVEFVKQSARGHTVVQAANPWGTCAPVGSPTFNINAFDASAPNGTSVVTAALNNAGALNFASTVGNDCILDGMFGTLMVTPSQSTATIIVGANNQLVFSPSTITVTAPATVNFIWDAANTRPHTVTSQSGTACTPGGPVAFSTPVQTQGMLTVTFNNAGVYPFFCDVHCPPMQGTITVIGGPTLPPATPAPPTPPSTPPPSAPPGTTVITVGGPGVLRFSPASVTVNTGTTVRWLWASDNTNSHNVISQSAPDQCTPGGPETLMTSVGTTFNAPGTVFEHVYNTPGNYYYFCNPHCSSGMQGVIQVVTPGGTTAPTLPPPPPPTTSNTTTNCYTNPNGIMTICWVVTGDTIEFTVTGRTQGWIATGISDDALMPQSDIFWGQFDSEGPVIVDRYADVRAQPPMDAQQDLSLVSGTEEGGVTTLRFTRRLITQPPDDRDLPITDRDVFLMWAYSDVDATRVRTRNGIQPDQFSFQQHLQSGTARVNLLRGGRAVVVNRQDKLRKAHGIMMILAWAMFSVIGTFIARFFKNLMGHAWFQSHRIIQMLAVILNLVAFILIVVWVGKQDVKHFRAPHQRLGLVILILSLFQPLLGFLADKLFDSKRKSAPFFPDILHWIIGYGVVILGLVNIWLGLTLYCVTQLAAIMFALVVGVTIFGFFVFEMMRLLAPWGSFLGSHGQSRGQPSALLGVLGAILALLVIAFSCVIAAEVGKENAFNPDPYFDGCIVPVLRGKQYWIRLSIYLGGGALAGVICLFVWLWRGKKSQSYEIALEGGALYHALEH